MSWLTDEQEEQFVANMQAAARAQKTEVVASECDLYGHDYQVRDYEDVSAGRQPEYVFCRWCGLSWKVER